MVPAGSACGPEPAPESFLHVRVHGIPGEMPDFLRAGAAVLELLERNVVKSRLELERQVPTRHRSQHEVLEWTGVDGHVKGLVGGNELRPAPRTALARDPSPAATMACATCGTAKRVSPVLDANPLSGTSRNIRGTPVAKCPYRDWSACCAAIPEADSAAVTSEGVGLIPRLDAVQPWGTFGLESLGMGCWEVSNATAPRIRGSRDGTRRICP